MGFNTRRSYSKKSQEGHLGVFFDSQKEIAITSELLGIFQPNCTGISPIWSDIWKYVNFFPKMAANMTAEIPNQIYLSSPFKYRYQQSVDLYKVKVVEYEYVKINNIGCVFSQMAAKMAAENYNHVSQLSFHIQLQIKC